MGCKLNGEYWVLALSNFLTPHATEVKMNELQTKRALFERLGYEEV